MERPLILLTPQTRAMEEPFRQNYCYTNCFNMDAICRAGGLPVLAPMPESEDGEALLSRADGLLLTGGEDIDPALYGQEKLDCCGKLAPQRDRSDMALLKAALKLHKPVLCICRGCQVANVYFGGTLYQDIPTQYPTELKHSAYDSYSQETAHRVELLPATPLECLLGERQIGVNSLHHQAVDRLADCLLPMARAEDGLIEGWYLPDNEQWLWGIQWHPEMLEDSARGRKIFEAFLEACRTHRSNT